MSDQKESRESKPREKITLDTVIPPLPSKSERLAPPDEDRFERELKNIDAKISKLRDKRKGVNDQIKVKLEGGKMDNQDLSVKEYIDSNLASRKEKVAYRAKLRDELDGLKKEFYLMVDEQKKIKPKIKIFNSEKTLKQIENIQHRIESTTLTLQEEKKLISELSELQYSVPLIQQHADRAKKLDDNKARQDVIKAQLDMINKEIDYTSTLINDTHAKIKNSKDQRSTEIPLMKEERKVIEDEIQVVEAERKKVVDDFKDKKYAYKKQQNDIKQIEFMTKMKARIIEQEERRKYEEEQAKFDEDNKPHPYAKEILSCDTYIAYLSKFIPKEETKTEEKTVSGDFLPPKTESGAKEVEEWFGAGKKKQKKGKKKRRVNEGFNHPIDMLNFFSYCGLKIPSTVEEMQASLKELQGLKGNWEKLEKREEGENKREDRKRHEGHEGKAVDLALNPVDFPEPEAHKTVEKYELFVDEGPKPPVVEENVRGKRGKRRGGRN